ncbi:MAG: helix-turn-helix domain-containing protein [Thermotogae bacterium]|nr:helix-turn-helix domain-containing protein [Thermotogota bacterium]
MVGERERKCSPKFKAEVTLETIKGDKTISQIASEYRIHPRQVRTWKEKFLENKICHSCRSRETANEK